MTHTNTFTYTTATILTDNAGQPVGVFSSPEEAYEWGKEHGHQGAWLVEFKVDHPELGSELYAWEDME